MDEVFTFPPTLSLGHLTVATGTTNPRLKVGAFFLVGEVVGGAGSYPPWSYTHDQIPHLIEKVFSIVKVDVS